MNKTDIQAHFDKCIKPLWDKQQFLFYGLALNHWFDKTLYINQNILVDIKVQRNAGATVELIRDAFRAYLGKFMVRGESITCYLNCYNSRIAIYTGFDSSKALTENPYKNTDLIQALQILVDYARKP